MQMSEAPELKLLREVETEWLANELGQAIANLGYPVGCGVAPHREQLMKAANTLFDRYVRMIELAGAAALNRSAGAQ
jgi:hypothetical protein